MSLLEALLVLEPVEDTQAGGQFDKAPQPD